MAFNIIIKSPDNECFNGFTADSFSVDTDVRLVKRVRVIKWTDKTRKLNEDFSTYSPSAEMSLIVNFVSVDGLIIFDGRDGKNE